MRERRRAAVVTAAVALLAGAVLAGCGGSKTAKVEAESSGGAPRPASVPKQDTALTKRVGAKLEALVGAGCAYGAYAEEGADHVAADELSWKTFPPASGKHLEQWADYGVYDEPVSDGYLVHDLEHGGVVVWLGEGVTAAQRTAVEALPEQGEKWVVVPREDLDGLAANAWAKGLACQGEALGQLEPEQLATALRAWYDAVESTGSEAEKDLPAYGSGLEDPAPERSTTVEAPF